MSDQHIAYLSEEEAERIHDRQIDTLIHIRSSARGLLNLIFAEIVLLFTSIPVAGPVFVSMGKNTDLTESSMLYEAFPVLIWDITFISLLLAGLLFWIAAVLLIFEGMGVLYPLIGKSLPKLGRGSGDNEVGIISGDIRSSGQANSERTQILMQNQADVEGAMQSFQTGYTRIGLGSVSLLLFIGVAVAFVTFSTALMLVVQGLATFLTLSVFLSLLSERTGRVNFSSKSLEVIAQFIWENTRPHKSATSAIFTLQVMNSVVFVIVLVTGLFLSPLRLL